MLVLFRRPGQGVFLIDPRRKGHDTKIVILSALTNGEVRLGIDAADDIEIVKEEAMLVDGNVDELEETLDRHLDERTERIEGLSDKDYQDRGRK